MPARKKNLTTPEDREEERREAARRANQSRNAEQLERRNAIAEGIDESRGEEFEDTDGETILPRKRTNNRSARSAEDEAEEAAARETQQAEEERQRLERAAEAGGDEEDEEPADRRPADEEDDDEAGDEGRIAADDEGGEEGEEGDSRVTNGVRYYRTIVNGKEKWRSLSQLRASASKVESADEYLQNAAASVRRAAELDPSHEDGQAGEEEDDDAEEILNKALLGDQEAVKKLALRLKATPSRVTPDVLRAVDERMTFRQAVNWFEEEFEDELSDPRLKAMIVQEDARLANANPTMSYRQRLKKAGNAIRKWKADLTGEPGDDGGGERPERRGSKTNEPSEKERRKRSLGTVPRAGGRLIERGDEGEEESVGTVIDQMAKGRGQTRAVRHEKH